MTFELSGWLPQAQRRVELILEAQLGRLAPRAPARLVEAMRYSLMAGGKRLRPVLCLAFADAAARASNGGGSVADDAAFALEAIHTYSLIHDDLPAMDDDDLRRGRPTSHKVFGEALAILAGDALLTEAFATLGGGAGQEALRARLVAELATAAGAGGMVGGQVLDVATDRKAEEQALVHLHRLKTGALLRAACRLGVLAGRGDDAALRAADAYGDAVGLAFQVTDDVLDVTSTPEVMGKPTQADAEAKRYTFPAIIGLEHSKARARQLLAQALDALGPLESEPGPLAALARYAVERTS